MGEGARLGFQAKQKFKLTVSTNRKNMAVESGSFESDRPAGPDLSHLCGLHVPLCEVGLTAAPHGTGG